MSARGWERAARAAGAAAAVSAGLALWGWARAAELEPLPGPGRVPPAARVDAVPPRPGYPAEIVVAAALEDPFRPEPPPPPPGGAPVPSPEALPPEPQAGPVQLVGTMVFPDGRAAAVCRLGSEPARVVRVGEKIGAYTLARVEPGRAVLTGPTGRIELNVLKPGA